MACGGNQSDQCVHSVATSAYITAETLQATWKNLTWPTHRHLPSRSSFSLVIFQAVVPSNALWTACTVEFAVPPLGKLPFLSFHITTLLYFFFFLTSRRNLPCTSQPPRWAEMLLYVLTASHSSPVIDYFIPDCDWLFFITISKVSNLRWQTRPFVVASNMVAVTP